MAMKKRYSKLGLIYVSDGKVSLSTIRGYSGAYHWLSNFHMARFSMRNIEFSSGEQAYQWLKDDSAAYRKRILAEHRPSVLKQIGKIAQRPDNWDAEERYKAMFEVQLAKFDMPNERRKLIATDTAYLEERNNHGDKHWGTCGGDGENHLGRIQMVTRHIKIKEYGT